MTEHKTITQIRQKLELSRLESQRELLLHDVDLTELSFITRDLPALRFDDLVTDGKINRTIEGASTVEITIDDTQGIIRNSGRLANKVDIKLDGLWFRLVKVQKSGNSATLTFESREVAVLRTYNGKRTVGWGKMRRSRFMEILVQEVKEFKIPFICPDLEALRLHPKKKQDKKDRAYKRQKGMGFKVDSGQPPVGNISQPFGGIVPKGGGVQNRFPPLYIVPGNNPGLRTIGTLNINARPMVKSGGGIHTVDPVLVGPITGATGFVVIPTVVGNQILSSADAQAHYGATNQHLGIFETAGNAGDYMLRLFKQQQEYIKKKTENKSGRSDQAGSSTTFNPSAVQAVFSLTIKGKRATKEQIDNVQQVLDVGTGMFANHKVLVSSIMTCIQESSCYNLTGGDGTSVGMFQEIDIWGSVAERRNIQHAAERYFTKAIKYDKEHPHVSIGALCDAVQRPRRLGAYDQWQNEAERLVTAYGAGDGTLNGNLSGQADPAIDGSQYQFTRGHPQTNSGGVTKWVKEDTWTCLQRLANEVNWRCFEVSGTIYFTTDKQLFRSGPRASINEDADGISNIDFDYDVGKPTSQVTVDCYIDRWAAPPGTVIELTDMGPVNGRWLVTTIERNIFDPLGRITLKKPEARLPEPKQSDQTSLLDALKEQQDAYVPTPGRDPQTKGLPIGKPLRDAVLADPKITFLHPDLQIPDIKQGRIDARVLQFLLNFTEAGFSVSMYALRSDHNRLTTSGNVSAHSTGNAVDMSNFNSGTYDKTFDAMTWIGSHLPELKVDQLIGPIPELCIRDGQKGPGVSVIGIGAYDAGTLSQHKTHIHVGFAPRK